MRDGEKVYLEQRVPCWVCSRSLATATTGPGCGKYVGRYQDAGGSTLVVVHDGCWQKSGAEGYCNPRRSDFPAINGEHALHGWRILPAPQDQDDR